MHRHQHVSNGFGDFLETGNGQILSALQDLFCLREAAQSGQLSRHDGIGHHPLVLLGSHAALHTEDAVAASNGRLLLGSLFHLALPLFEQVRNRKPWLYEELGERRWRLEPSFGLVELDHDVGDVVGNEVDDILGLQLCVEDVLLIDAVLCLG